MSGDKGLCVVDAHVHVASTRFIPRAFIRGVAENFIASATSRAALEHMTAAHVETLLIAQHQDHNADQLIMHMDAAGIKKAVLLIPDFTHTLECEMSIAAMAAEHHLIRQRHPGRFYVFQGIDPRSGIDGVDLFERILNKYGFNGLKLYPPCGYSPSDERLYPYYEVCKQRALPVLIHTGPTSPVLDFNLAHPHLIDRAARTFAQVNFILAHGGVNHVADATALCRYRPNVYLDIAGFPAAMHPHGWRQQLRELFALGINHKIIFGTDWPVVGTTIPIKVYVDEMKNTEGPLRDLSHRQVQEIMGQTIERLIAADSSGRQS